MSKLKFEERIPEELTRTEAGKLAASLLTEFNKRIEEAGFNGSELWDEFLAKGKSHLAIMSFVLNYKGEPDAMFTGLKKEWLPLYGFTKEKDIGLTDVLIILNQLPKVEKRYEKILVDYIYKWLGGNMNAPYYCELLFRMLALNYPAKGTFYRGECRRLYTERPDVPMLSFTKSKEVAENYAGLSQSLVGKPGFCDFRVGKPFLFTDSSSEGLDLIQLVQDLVENSAYAKEKFREVFWEQEVVLFKSRSDLVLPTSNLF